MDVRQEVAAAGGSKRMQKEKENTVKKQTVNRRMNAADDQEGDVNEMADAFCEHGKFLKRKRQEQRAQTNI
ncbi:hypothetical protein FF1_028759 [Malus domestica]